LKPTSRTSVEAPWIYSGGDVARSLVGRVALVVDGRTNAALPDREPRQQLPWRGLCISPGDPSL
jgi:hypothetical protein